MKEPLFAPEDLKNLVFQKKKSLFLIAFFSLIASFFLLFDAPIVYEATTLFQEGPSQKQEAFHDLRNLLAEWRGSEPDGSSIPAMTSYEVLRPLIAKLGLQAQFNPQSQKEKIINQLLDLIHAELKIAPSEKLGALFEEVEYEGEIPLSFSIVFEGGGRFSLFRQTTRLSEGKLHEKCRIGPLSFILRSIPSSLKPHTEYPITFLPWIEVADTLKEKITSQADPDNPSLFSLSFTSENRRFAAHFLNSLVQEYLLFLKKNHDALAKEQLSYLKRRQEELFSVLENHLTTHQHHLEKMVQEKGLPPLTDAFTLKIDQQEALLDRLLAIEIEKAKLKEDDGSFALHELLSQKSYLELSLSREELLGRLLPSLPDQIFPELVGIDLETAKALYLEASREIAQLEKGLRSHELLFKTTPTAACLYLTDPLSRRLGEVAAEISLKMQDEENYSSKELMRLKEELSLQHALLKTHLANVQEIKEEEIGRARQKMGALQRIQLEHLERKMDLLRKELIEEKGILRLALEKEEAILRTKLRKIREEMAEIPAAWKKDKILQMKAELTSRFAESITQLVESKTVASEMHRLSSKALDIAYPPLHPKPPRFFARLFLSAFAGALIAFLFFLLQGLFRGFPLSIAKLKELGHPVLTGDKLRKGAFFLRHAKSCGLFFLERKESLSIAKSLSFQGETPLLIDCSFQGESKNGLKEALLGEEAHIDETEAIPILHSGGPFDRGAELLGSDRFFLLVEALKKRYSILLFCFEGSSDALEIALLLPHLEKAIVSSKAKQIEPLTPFFSWSYHDKGHRLALM